MPHSLWKLLEVTLIFNLVLLPIHSSWGNPNKEDVNPKSEENTATLEIETTTLLSSKNESWYLWVDGGAAATSYKAKIGQDIEPDFSGQDYGGNFDYLGAEFTIGFYFPNPIYTAIFGPSLGLGLKTFSLSREASTEVKMTLINFDVDYSYIRYFGTNIGDGFFIRGDFGISILLHTAAEKCETTACYGLEYDDIEDEINVTQSDYDETDAKLRIGYGGFLGGGYSWVIGKETRLQTLIGYSLRTFEGELSGTGKATLGALF